MNEQVFDETSGLRRRLRVEKRKGHITQNYATAGREHFSQPGNGERAKQTNKGRNKIHKFGEHEVIFMSFFYTVTSDSSLLSNPVLETWTQVPFHSEHTHTHIPALPF